MSLFKKQYVCSKESYVDKKTKETKNAYHRVGEILHFVDDVTGEAYEKYKDYNHPTEPRCIFDEKKKEDA